MKLQITKYEDTLWETRLRLSWLIKEGRIGCMHGYVHSQSKDFSTKPNNNTPKKIIDCVNTLYGMFGNTRISYYVRYMGIKNPVPTSHSLLVKYVLEHLSQQIKKLM